MYDDHPMFVTHCQRPLAAGRGALRMFDDHPVFVTHWLAALRPVKNHHGKALPWWFRVCDCQLTSASVMARISFFCWGVSNLMTLWILPSS